MIVVSLMSLKPGKTSRDAIGRRLQWEYPEGMKIIGEYWLQVASPRVVVIWETDNVAEMLRITADWGDIFDITVAPALRGEEGIALTRQMMQ